VDSFRYRTGLRQVGPLEWERYLEIENLVPEQRLEFSAIHYGEVKTSDVVLQGGVRAVQIKLNSGPLSSWGWDLRVRAPTQKQ
jgi:hypothetical protein